MHSAVEGSARVNCFSITLESACDAATGFATSATSNEEKVFFSDVDLGCQGEMRTACMTAAGRTLRGKA